MREIVPQYHNNPAQRTPCMLVLDASGSMDELVPATGRKRIDELNAGLQLLRDELLNDDAAAQRVQLAITCVGGPAGEADLLMDWTDAVSFQPQPLQAGGLTPLGQGMRLALQHVEKQKSTLKASGVGHTRPWIIVISDGEPTDDAQLWQAVAQECRSAEAAKRCVIYPIGVGDANMGSLQQLSSTPALKMADAKFRQYFQWLSGSLSTLSGSRPGEQVQLAATSPWTVVSS